MIEAIPGDQVSAAGRPHGLDDGADQHEGLAAAASTPGKNMPGRAGEQAVEFGLLVRKPEGWRGLCHRARSSSVSLMTTNPAPLASTSTSFRISVTAARTKPAGSLFGHVLERCFAALAPRVMKIGDEVFSQLVFAAQWPTRSAWIAFDKTAELIATRRLEVGLCERTRLAIAGVLFSRLRPMIQHFVGDLDLS
jgi:hypothetical protein